MNYTDDIDWQKIAANFPASNRTITPVNLKRRFRKLVVYRIPFHYKLNFNDTIDILMENFVKPYKEGRLHYGNEKWRDEKRRKKQAGEEEEEEEGEGIKKEECAVLNEEDSENEEGDREDRIDVPHKIKGEIFSDLDDDTGEGVLR